MTLNTENSPKISRFERLYSSSGNRNPNRGSRYKVLESFRSQAEKEAEILQEKLLEERRRKYSWGKLIEMSLNFLYPICYCCFRFFMITVQFSTKPDLSCFNYQISNHNQYLIQLYYSYLFFMIKELYNYPSEF